MDYNKVVLVGRVGRDPETKNVGGKTLVNFSLATGYGTGDKAKTNWHQIQAWEKLGEIAQQILHKGDRVLVEGRIEYNVTGDKEAGTQRTFTQITISNLINLSPRADGGSVGKTTSATQTSVVVPVNDEDIPF